MWRKTRNGDLQWHGMTTALKEEQIEGAKDRLENELLNAGWQTVHPRWLNRQDKLWEFRDQRILTDNGGVFMYVRQPEGWRRIAGLAMFDKTIIWQGFKAGG